MGGADRSIEVGELLLLARRDQDVQTMITVFCDHHHCDLVELSEQHGEAFDRLYDACYDMIAQMGEWIDPA